MSKKNRRSSGSFRTVGQRMLSFGRGIMRTYANETSLQPDATSSEPSRPRGQWRSMTTDSLIWRQEQPAAPAPPPAQQMSDVDQDADYYESDYADYDDMGMPIQRQPQPRRQQPVQRQPQQQSPPKQPKKPTPSYIQTEDGTPVQTSRKQFSSPLQRRLDAIMAAHEEKNSERVQQRDQKIENIQRKVEKGELTTRRRRGSIDVDYVQTESLLPVEERGKQPETPIQRQETTQSSDTGDSDSGHDAPDEANWFDEIPDDDADIDGIAGFESSDDAVQRMPDDLPQFDMSSLEQEEDADDMGEFEGGYDEGLSQSADSSDTIRRDYDERYDEPTDSNDRGDGYSDAGDSNDTPVQRSTQDYELPMFEDMDNEETVPLIPNMDLPDVGSPIPPTDTSLQRTEAEDDASDNQDYGDDADPDFSNLDPSPRSDAPIQRTEWDDTPSFTDFGDVSDDDDAGDYGDGSYTDFSDVNPSSDNDAPVQRNRIQRTELDDTLTDFDDDTNNTSLSDAPNVTASSAPDSPVQRSETDESSSYTGYDEDDYDDTAYTDFSDASTSHEAPVQRDIYDDGAYGEDMPDVGGQASEPPVQRDYDDDFDEEIDGEDMPDVGGQVGEPPVQRDYDDYSDYDAYDEGDFGDLPDVNASSDFEAPVQRDTSDDYYTDFSDVADVEPATTSDVPPVQRQAFDVEEMSTVSDDFDDGPMESLSISSPDDDPPVQRRRIQRDPADDMPTDDTPVQQQSTDHPDLGDGGDYSDYGDETWAEMNDYAPATDATDNVLSNTPVQRDYDDEVDDAVYGDEADYGDYDERAYVEDMPDVGGQVSEARVQRDYDDEADYSDYDDEADYSDYDDGAYVEDMPDVGGQVSEARVQRNYDDEADYGDYDDEANDEFDIPEMGINAGESLSIQPPSVQRSEMDERTFDMIDNADSLSIDAPAERSSVQRSEMDEPQDNDDDYDDYGDATWAEMNDYAPATDRASSSDSPIQRDLDDTQPYEPYGEDEYDHLEDTDGMTAMNILGDYLADQPGGDTGSDRPNVQRRYADDEYDYLPEDFDPTPSFYDFEQQADGIGDVDNGDPVQRSTDDDYDDSDMPAQNGMDLFQALSQAGMIDTPPPNQKSPSQSPIQRDVQDDGMDDETDAYGDYGDATWAEVHNYSPATDNARNGDSSIQRTPEDDFTDEPMDLFHALSQSGMIDTPQTPSDSSQSPIQRDYQDDDSDADDSGEMMDLYNAMLQSGMIQDSSKVNPSSSNSDPIQRSPQSGSQSSPDDIMEALMKASQVSESSSANNNSSNRTTSNAPQVNNGMSQGMLQREDVNDPIAPNENVTTPSTNREDIDDKVTEEDKEYLSQLARDVFRVIKRRLREEKERRG